MNDKVAKETSLRVADWDDYRFFLAVSAAGSLSAAARALRVNTTTVLRRIGHLEQSLDVRLFERLRSGYALTNEGARLLQALDPVDQRLSALERDFQSGKADEKGVIRLGLNTMLAAKLVAPALARFNAASPDIIMDMVIDHGLSGPGAAPRVLNHLRDVDVALRLARPTQGDMLVRKLGDLAYGLYASQGYLAAQAAEVSASDLSGHNIIGFLENEMPVGPVWWMSRMERTGDVVMRASCSETRQVAVASGLGVGALPVIAADADPTLVQILPPSTIGMLELWLLVRSDMAKMPKIRQVMDFLVSEVQNNNERLQGMLKI
mgnify:CR=1 FL=1